MLDIEYEQLPGTIKDNLSPEQWKKAQRDLVMDGQRVPEDAFYINVKNGERQFHRAGEPADGPLLPAWDLSGARGKSDEQFDSPPQLP